MAFFGMIVHFSHQILKSIHLVCLSFWDMSCDPEFRILISVQKMCPYNTIQEFLFNLGMKARMHLVEISIFSLNHVIVRPTKIIKDLCKAST